MADGVIVVVAVVVLVFAVPVVASTRSATALSIPSDNSFTS